MRRLFLRCVNLVLTISCFTKNTDAVEIIVEESTGDRLDAYLAARLPDLSRSRIQALIREQFILVSGKPAKPRDWAFTQLGKKRFARDQRFLLHEDGRLYDIPNDLFEKKDLSASTAPQVAGARQRLTAVLEQCK